MRISDWSSDVCSSDLMIDLRDTLRDAHNYAPASIRKLLGSLSAACRAAEDKGVIVVRPKFPKVRVDNEKDRVVSLDEEVAMFQRSAERRVGNECVSTCISRWSRYH